MDAPWLAALNDQQRTAVWFGNDPLLIIAGAGTGKTNTLAHRVAWLISTGIDPSRILLLTFTRRAAAEMLKRVESILARTRKAGSNAILAKVWGGTFHAMANRLLRIHCDAIGFAPNFNVLDRSDSEDVMNDVRAELNLESTDVRFPKKSTCLSIYSRCVNAREPIEDCLKAFFPWCAAYPEKLKHLFKLFVERKQSQNILDYDDLLLYWHHLMQEPQCAQAVRERFSAVLVDEYQDTNALQASILKALCPDGKGLTVVGDDAQSIYSFRAATVRNILDFPRNWPNATVLKLEQNYRSVQPILDCTNRVIALAADRFDKELFSTRVSAQKPRLVSLTDEDQQSDYVIRRILEHHEAGIPLRKQAVLFRTAHHSDSLEVELGRRNIPFVKYGGLKFLEAAHVKDALSFLRLAENPRDATSALRVLQLMDGFGPAHAKRAITHLSDNRCDLKCWLNHAPPAAATGQWGTFVSMLIKLAPDDLPLGEQLAEVRRFYLPILEKRYDHAELRARDIEQLEQISGNFQSRQKLLTDLTLDPPHSTQDLSGPPLLEEDYLILSTIHSAKGCEWDCVYVIHAADGNIPSDMACGTADEIEEERRLFYVALTRARDFLEVCFPLKYYHKKWSTGDRHSYAQLTRFVPDALKPQFEQVSLANDSAADAKVSVKVSGEIRKKVAGMWG